MDTFIMNTIGFVKSLPPRSFFHIKNVTQGPTRARNVMTRKGLKAGKFEYVLYMDDDELPEPGSVQELINMDELVVSGLVPRTNRPHHPPVGDFHPIDGYYRDLLDFPLDRPFKVDACGSGFLLVHRDIFDLIEFPWWEKIEHPYMSEDINFCRKLNENGIRPTVNPLVRVGHLEGRHIFRISDFIEYKTSGTVYRWDRDPRYYPR